MRKVPPLNWLRAFEATARHLSFSLAAKELNVTQSAISQHIKLLEHHVKTPLFIRSPKKLTLTETGKQYLPLVSHAFLQLESATDEIFGEDKTVVRLHCNVAFSTLFIAPRLASFQADYPHIEIQLQHSVWWQHRLEHHLETPLQRALEIRYGDGNWSMPSVSLGENVIFPVMGKNYSADNSDLALTMTALAQHRLFQLSGVRHNWRLWLLRAGVALDNEVPLNTLVQSDCSTVLHSLAVRNQGLSLLSSVLADYGLANGELYRPFDYQLPIKEGFYLIKPSKYDSPNEQLFAEWLLDSCRA
ncbi:MAG: hypothetical protein CR975_06615 [Gammaproteobacteria bacterium]|nr:MAG: hypothetical protein CR975_06615 [Gammaproteobacteria bacterium]